MKIIEAMKKVKENKQKMTDLRSKVQAFCANLNYEQSPYPDPKGTVTSWLQSCEDLSKENVRLLTAIARTNLQTTVSIDLHGHQVTKSIAEWVWRRREYAKLDQMAWECLTDRNLREGANTTSTGVPLEIKIVRHFEPVLRDTKVNLYKFEPHLIDSKLEVINAITDLIE